jgi:DNA-binding transcriptional regulator YiaG
MEDSERQAALAAFISGGLASASPSSSSEVRPDPAARERARQEALKARAANIATWRNFVATKEPAATGSGATVRQLREAVGLDTSALGDILGIHRQDVEAIESSQGERVTVLNEQGVRKFVSAARDLILSTESA